MNRNNDTLTYEQYFAIVNSPSVCWDEDQFRTIDGDLRDNPRFLYALPEDDDSEDLPTDDFQPQELPRRSAPPMGGERYGALARDKALIETLPFGALGDVYKLLAADKHKRQNRRELKHKLIAWLKTGGDLGFTGVEWKRLMGRDRATQARRRP